MKTELKQLRKQYLQAVDDTNAALRNLQTDYMELLLYDRILSGEIEPDQSCPDSMSIFFRACENLSTHLAQMEKACAQTQALHREMMKK